LNAKAIELVVLKFKFDTLTQMSTPLDKLRLHRERPTDLDAGSTERVNVRGEPVEP